MITRLTSIQMISYFIKIISRSGITRNKKTVNRLVFVFKQAPKSLISNSGIRFGLMLIAIFIQSTSAYSQSQQSKTITLAVGRQLQVGIPAGTLRKQ